MIESERLSVVRRGGRGFVIAVIVAILFVTSSDIRAQSSLGNSVSGIVFGIDRRPVGDVYVELLNDLSQSIRRTRTNASGQYSFYGIPAGRFIVRVLPLGTDYETQEQGFEIDNFQRGTGTDRRITGMMSEQRDFYLRPRKGVMPGVTGAIFVQDVPESSRKLYKQATEDFAQKKRTEAYAALKTALETFPKYFDALELLGLEYARDKHFDAARILLAGAVEVNPRAYKSWHGLGVAYNSLGNQAEALTAVEKALEINPVEPQSLLLAGSMLRQAKRYSEAEKRLLKAKEIFEGTSSDVHWELALLYGNGMNRYKDAARELKLFLKAKPDYGDEEKKKIEKVIANFEEKAKASG
ncbi:MAG TPA: tetratricopeptide repeat protein [Pyrinomonadaceae bacterium]|nr:tetratricopeptide repeat protein [Pyrinomonadaceae bacterium]